MFEQASSIKLEFPEWISSFALSYTADPDIEVRMQFVINASMENIYHQTGGPFAAAIFDATTFELVSLGANIVLNQQQSILHAEMVAISLAQKKLGTHDLSSTGNHYQLVTSSEPCAMCFGAIPWSGIQSVVCGATTADVESTGFDEGPKPSDWKAALESRKIEIKTEVLRDEARKVLDYYKRLNGLIYNPG